MRKELTPVTTKKNVKQKQKWQKQKRTEEKNDPPYVFF